MPRSEQEKLTLKKLTRQENKKSQLKDYRDSEEFKEMKRKDANSCC
jgi:hypothetical protein